MPSLKSILSWILSLAIVLLFSAALLHQGFFRVHDYTHVARLVELQRSFSAGHIPVHWTQNFGFGYGMPLFLFYGPLPFYTANIISFFGFSPLLSIQLTFVLAGILAFTGMYSLLQTRGRLAALIGGAVLLAAPYRAVDIYVRGALNEVFAIGLLPWFLWAALQIPKKPKTGVLATALVVSALWITHNLTAFIGLPLLGIFCVVSLLSEKDSSLQKKAQSVLLFFTSGLFGTLLSIWYIVPAFLEKGETSIESILSGYFDFRLHFLYIRQLLKPQWGYGGSEPGPLDGMTFHVGIPLLALVALFGIWLVVKLVKRWFQTKKITLSQTEVLFFTASALAGLSLFMTLFHSQFLWKTIPLLSFVQFPWRFMSVAVVLFAFLAGLSISLTPNRIYRTLIAIVFLVVLLANQKQYHKPEKWLDRPEDFYYTDPAIIRSNMSDILPDYIPKTLAKKITPVDTQDRIAFSQTPESGSYSLQHPHEVLWLGKTPENTTVTWNIAHFSGWKYFVNDTEVSPQLSANGVMQYSSDVPITSVGAQFTATPIRQWSMLISGIGWIIWLMLFWLPETKLTQAQETHHGKKRKK